MQPTPEQYEIIFKEVAQMAEQYFNSNDEIQALYKQPTTINFAITTETRPIYSERISDYSYEVKISKKWLDQLWTFASDLSNDERFLALVDISKANNIFVRNYLFYFYADIIICHEWAHIFCGHLNFKIKHMREKSGLLSVDEARVGKALELEADSWASRLVLARLAENHEYIKSLIFGTNTKSKLKSDKTWDLFTYSLTSLFNHIKVSSNGTHPIPIHRIYASVMMAVGEIVDKLDIRKELPPISDDPSKVYAIFMSFVNRFYTEYKGYSQKDFEGIMFEAAEHCSTIGKIIEEIDLNDYRLIKGKWT